jgi:DNA-binding MarR family transcriptional regulator
MPTSSQPPIGRRPAQPAEVLTLTRLARMLERASGELTLAQYRLLALISEGEDRASTLAGHLALGKPTISATVETMVERGLLERASVEGDRRAVRLEVTGAGRTALETAQRSMGERLDAVLAHVTDRAQVEESLDQLRGALDAWRAQLSTERSGSTPSNRGSA